MLLSQANVGIMMHLSANFSESPKPSLECFWPTCLDWQLFLTTVGGNSGERPQTNCGDHYMNELNHNNTVQQTH